jgi:autotransporter-associated beta strand protein
MNPNPIRICLPIICLLLIAGALNGNAQQTSSFTTPGTVTWTCPLGVSNVTVQAWGGGGAGGGANRPSSANAAAGGGGGGAYASSTVSVTPGTGYAVVVGAGGNATTPATLITVNGTAAPGTNSSFGGTTVVAAGGGGGSDTISSYNTAFGSGGTTANSTGTTKFAGGNGAGGASSHNAGGGGSSAGTGANGGTASVATGGTAPTGGGAGGAGVAGVVNANGSSGSTPGGAGGGAGRYGTGSQTGGNGAAGKVILTYTQYYDQVNVETAADGSGSIISPQNVSSGNSITVYAIGRTSGGTYITNVPAVWSLVNISGNVVSGDLVPAGNNQSAVFTAHLSGSAKIQAVVTGVTLQTNVSGLVTVPATGVTAVWTNNADSVWTATTNWNPSVPGSPGDTAILGVGSALRTVTLDANESLGALSFTNANSFVIAGSSLLTMSSGSSAAASIIVSGGSANQIQTPVALADNATVNVSGGDSLAITGVVSNTLGATSTLSLPGAGMLVLSGNDSYGPSTGGAVGTVLSGGAILQVGSAGALGFGDLTNAGNSTLQSGGAGLNITNNIGIGSGVTATVDNNGNNLALSGVISGSGTVAKIGSGTLTLSGANTYGGSTTVANGVLSIASDANLGTAPGSATANSLVLGSSTADLLLTGTATLNTTRGIGIGATSGSTPGTALIDVSSGTLTINGVIASAGNTGANNLTINGSSGTGTVVLGGANTFSGTTLISAGTLTLGNSLALQNSTLNYISGTLGFGSLTAATFGGLSGAQNLALLNGSTAAVALTVGGNNSSTTYSGILSGTGASLTKNGSGTLTLTGNNSYSGTTTGNAGTLEISTGGAISGGALFGQGYLVDGGTVTSTGASSFNAVNNAFTETSGSVNLGAVNQPNGAGDGQLINITGGTFNATSLGLMRSGSTTTPPTATVPQAASTAGGLYINGSTANVNLGSLSFALENSSDYVRLDSGSLTVTNELLVGNMANTRWSILQINGGTFNASDTNIGIVLSQVSVTATATNGNFSEAYFSGGASTVGKICFGWAADTAVTAGGGIGGTGWLIVTNATLYLGSGGIVQSNTANYSANISLLNGVLGAKADWSSSLPMQLSGPGFTFQAADSGGTAHNITLSGVLSGAGGLTNTGNGTLTLDSAGNNFSGLTTINAGKLNINSEWALGGANYSGLVFNNGMLQYAATLLNSTTDLSAKPVTFTGNATIDVNGNAISFANAIGNSGPGGLTVESSLANGVLTLAGVNTYTGNTTVSSGTLLVNGSTTAGGTVGVASGATLGGTGTVGGATTVSAGGKLAAGDPGAGTLSFGSSLTLNSASANNFTVNNTGGALNKIAVAGTLTPNTSVIRISNSGAPLVPGTYNLLTYASKVGAFSATPVFDVGAAVHPAAIVDDNAGNINLVVPNAAPVAGASFAIGATIGVPITVPIVGGKYPPTDADGDSLTISSVTGEANGTATISGNNIIYTATAGTTDSFTYTVSDPYGATASQTVSVNINATGESFNQLSAPVDNGDGTISLKYLGIPGYNYAVEATTSLAQPITWTPVVTNTASSNGQLNFTISTSAGNYFRTRYVP